MCKMEHGAGCNWLGVFLADRRILQAGEQAGRLAGMRAGLQAGRLTGRQTSRLACRLAFTQVDIWYGCIGGEALSLGPPHASFKG